MMAAEPRLLEEDAGADPVALFQRWFDEARRAGEPQPEAMALATASTHALPSVRMVLLKGVDERGFVFHTDYESAKGRDLAVNPRAAMSFHWYLLHRQVRVAGTVGRVPAEESDAYFQSRPRGAQVSAAASPQSRPVTRSELEAAVARVSAAHPAGVPRPPNWGGFRLSPDTLEFWQGRADRLHDRLRYTRERLGAPDLAPGWRIDRLAP
ncbi:MAG: pyridoxamine 5'-phosphate oxidase [Candidatus Dormibacteraceae bacterium]